MAQAARVGTEFLVNTNTANIQLAPAITDLTNGGFVITWEDLSGTLGDADGYSVKAQIYSASGVRVGSEFLVNTNTAGFQYLPTVTGLTGGGFVVTWDDNSGTLGDASRSSIKAQIYDASGARVGTEFLVNTNTADIQEFPTIAGLTNGGFVVTWDDYSGTLGDAAFASNGAIKAQIYNASGARVGNEFLVNTSTTGNQVFPTITRLTGGGFVISWQDYSGTLGDADSSSIKAQIYDASGARVGSEFLVNTNTANDQIQPTIIGLTNGGFVVSWEDGSGTLDDSSGYSIKAQIYSASGVRVGDEFLVNTNTTGDQFIPTITSLTNGGFVVSWDDSSGTLGDSSGTSIKAQVYDASGARVGTEFLVNTNTANLQQLPTITGLTNGDFVVSWADFSGTLGDTSIYSIKAQIFTINHDPVITSDGGGDSTTISVSENSSAVTTVHGTDVDASTTLAYAISGGGDAALFQIDGATGALSFKTAPDFEAPTDANHNNIYNVTVSASDGSLTDTQALKVTVTDVNEAPDIDSNGGGASVEISVSENSSAVTTVHATDVDTGTTLAYAISGGADAALFQIDGATGALSFKTAPDFEAPTDDNHNNVYRVIVSASDGTLADTQAFRITVADANDAPVITSDGGGASVEIGVSENSSTVTTVHATDVDAGTTLAYAISGGADAALFQIDGVTGALSFKSAPDFETPTDSDLNNIYRVRVSASDGTLVDTQLLIITVANANEAPVITSDGGGANAAISVSENGTTVATVHATDADAGTTLAYSISGGADAALFQIDGATGALTFKTAPDFEAPTDANHDNVYQVSVSASDGTLADSQAFSITVTDVPDLLVRYGSPYADSLLGGALGDKLYGLDGDDVLGALGGDDELYGGAGRDILSGGAGNDLLVGGAGQDTLIGGSGKDIFRFDTADMSHDLVKDFTKGEDLIQIDGSVFAALAAYIGGEVGADAFVLGSKAKTADQHLIYNQAKGQLLYDADGSGAGAAVNIGAFTNHADIDVHDIIII